MLRRFELPGWSDERILTEIPYARFIQMLRVIGQERFRESAFVAWHLSDGSRTFSDFCRTYGIDRTPAALSAAEKLREIDRVAARLGRLYRPPIKA